MACFDFLRGGIPKDTKNRGASATQQQKTPPFRPIFLHDYYDGVDDDGNDDNVLLRDQYLNLAALVLLARALDQVGKIDD